MIDKNMTDKTKYFFSFISIIFTDFITKYWALNNLVKHDIFVFSGFNFSLAFNRGVSWGLFSFNNNLAFNILTSVILLIILIFAFHAYTLFKQKKPIIFEVLILSGAVANILERIFYGRVTDFIDFYIFCWHWPTFNIADIFVVIGVFGVLGRLWLDGYTRKN